VGVQVTARVLMGVLAIAGGRGCPDPRVAVLYVPAGGCALHHRWTAVADTGRHHYQQCSCGARRIVDQAPHDQPTDLLDVSWACRSGDAPDLSRCTRLVERWRPLVEAGIVVPPPLPALRWEV